MRRRRHAAEGMRLSSGSGVALPCSKPSGDLHRCRSAAPRRSGQFEEGAAPVPLKDKKATAASVEADVARAATRQIGKDRPSFLDRLVAHAFNQIRNGVYGRAHIAAVKNLERKH